MKVYQVFEDCTTVYATRSESLAYQRAIRCQNEPVWIVEMVLDTHPHHEVVWGDLEAFKKEFSV